MWNLVLDTASPSPCWEEVKLSPVEVGECPGHGAMLVLVANTDPRGGRGLEREGRNKTIWYGAGHLQLGFHQEYWGAYNSSHYSSHSAKVQSSTGDHLISLFLTYREQFCQGWSGRRGDRIRSWSHPLTLHSISSFLYYRFILYLIVISSLHHSFFLQTRVPDKHFFT